ncbi:MAG: CDP-diacylglycerol--serine O-phosphatidyltransferase [Deltaproteobacteria bacterium]|nr:CDP-diacylglycerol--serine O-phosphatidyltransferase [Deltaproteobacteria bacterium]
MSDELGNPSGEVRREGIKRGIYLIPSLFTLANLLLAYLAIVKTLHHDFSGASWCVIVAGLCDSMDGRLARLARAESRFGVEFDSLADLVAFGVAPAVMLYSWSMASFDRIGWLATFLYLACGTLRLARYNVQLHTVEKRFFQGLPIPAAAGMIACTILFYTQQFGPVFPLRQWWVVGLTVLLSALMISTLPYRSFKQLNLRSRRSFFSLLLVIGVFVLVALEPVSTLFGIAVVYLASGLVEELVTRKHSKAVVAKLRKQRTAVREAQQVLREKVHILPRGDQHS